MSTEVLFHSLAEYTDFDFDSSLRCLPDMPLPAVSSRPSESHWLSYAAENVPGLVRRKWLLQALRARRGHQPLECLDRSGDTPAPSRAFGSDLGSAGSCEPGHLRQFPHLVGQMTQVERIDGTVEARRVEGVVQNVVVGFLVEES